MLVEFLRWKEDFKFQNMKDSDGSSNLIKMTFADPTKERRLEKGDTMYVPRDESFEQIKETNFIANSLRGLVHRLVPALTDYFDETPGEFDAFSDIEKLYHQGLKLNSEDLDYDEPANRFLVDSFLPDIVRGLSVAHKEPNQVKERSRLVEALPIPDYYKELLRSSNEPTSLLQYPLPKILSSECL